MPASRDCRRAFPPRATHIIADTGAVCKSCWPEIKRKCWQTFFQEYCNDYERNRNPPAVDARA